MKNNLAIFKLILICFVLSSCMATRILKRTKKGLEKIPKDWASDAIHYIKLYSHYVFNFNPIGKGGFGVVFKAKKNGSEYAVKLIYIGNDETGQRSVQARREVNLTKAMANSSFVIPICDTREFEQDKPFGSTFMIAFPIAKYDLEKEIKYIHLMNKQDVGETLIQMALPVKDLHKERIIHKDIKPGNFLRMKDGRVMLTDFGLAIRKQDAISAKIKSGTPFYIPHDVKKPWFKKQKLIVSKRIDIFALGLTMGQYLIRELDDCLMGREDCIMPKDNTFDLERSLKSDHFFSQLKTFYSILLKEDREISEKQLKLEKFIFTKMLVKLQQGQIIGTRVFRASAKEVVKKLKEIYPEEFKAVEEKYGVKPDYCKQDSSGNDHQ